MVMGCPGSTVPPQRKPGDSAISAFSSWRSASQMIWSMGPLKLPRRYNSASAVASGSANCAAYGRAKTLDQRLHIGIRFEQIGIDRQQLITHVLDLTFADFEVQHGQEFSARPSIGDQRLAGSPGNNDGSGNGVMGVSSQNNVNPGNAAWQA